MVAINIPAYCSTCGTIFPSPIALDSGATVGIKVCEAICPKGHVGRVLDGTFDFVEGIMNISNAGPVSQEVLAKMLALAQDAAEGKIDPDAAINEIAEFLPRDSAAAIKKLGGQNPLTAILIILTVIGTLTTIYRTLNPSAPLPSPIINNNITVTNQATAGDGGNNTVLEPLNREQTRRLKQIETKKKKLARKGHTNTKPKG